MIGHEDKVRWAERKGMLLLDRPRSLSDAMTFEQKPGRRGHCISERKILQSEKTANAKVLRPAQPEGNEGCQIMRTLHAMLSILAFIAMEGFEQSVDMT